MTGTPIAATKTILTRFGPYLAFVAAVAAVLVFSPGDDESELSSGGDGFAATDSTFGTDGSDGEAGATTTDTVQASDTTEGSSSTSPGSSSSDGSASPATSAGTSGDGGRSQTNGSADAGAQMVENCDPETGRIKTPSHYAPPCVPAFDGDNGGSTYQGVTEDTIKLAIFLVEGDAASEAALTAAGSNDSEADVRQQYLDWVDYYSTHYEQYGREIDVTFYKGSGPTDDDGAGRADAVRIANDGNFAVLNAPNNAFVDEIVARGVMCMCTVSLPGSFYQDRAPFVWGLTLMDSFQGYTHRAEFIAKRLAGRKAEFAGSPALQLQDRVFGLAYYDDEQQSYRPGIDFFIRHLRENYGIELAANVAYQGYPQVAKSQEAARPLIQKMIAEDVTSVVCACDPFAPVFFTQEATRQNYRPEWIITGSALTDTAFFARTYDQTQWSNAFGVSFLTAGLPEELSEDYRKYEWHFGRGPVAEAEYSVIDSPVKIFFDGVHLAGERLDPGTFRDGMFRDQPRATGLKTASYSSFGTELWGRPDYTAFDDITLIWWDPRATGEDETGQVGVGLYRYVDGGKRYLPGTQPDANTKAFQREGTVAGSYDSYPEGEAPPDYPPPS